MGLKLPAHLFKNNIRLIAAWEGWTTPLCCPDIPGCAGTESSRKHRQVVDLNNQELVSIGLRCHCHNGWSQFRVGVCRASLQSLEQYARVHDGLKLGLEYAKIKPLIFKYLSSSVFSNRCFWVARVVCLARILFALGQVDAVAAGWIWMCCFHAVRPVKPVAKIMLLGDSPSKPRSQVTMWCLVHLSFFLVFGFFPTRLCWVHSCFAGNFFQVKKHAASRLQSTHLTH